MRLIEALKPDYDVTVVTTGGWDLDDLNQAYCASVRPDDAEVRLAPFPRVFGRYPLAMLRYAFYQRFCRQIAGQFDVRISAYNCVDWGLPGIHFIADFAWDAASCKADMEESPRPFFYRDTLLRRVYLGLAKRLMRPSGRDPLREDWVIANSQWSARRLAGMGISVRCVIYPSCARLEFLRVAWAEREQAFLSLSRIAPEKRIEFIIEVLAAVRRDGFPVSLYLAGQADNAPYGRYVEALCRKHSDWVRQVGRVTGGRKNELLSRCRYGLNAGIREAFGITVWEMVAAGCIPFVHSASGSAEIVDHPALLFSNEAEAKQRIVSVLSSESLQAELLDHLARQAERFSPDETVGSFRRVVDDFLQEMGGQ